MLISIYITHTYRYIHVLWAHIYNGHNTYAETEAYLGFYFFLPSAFVNIHLILKQENVIEVIVDV